MERPIEDRSSYDAGTTSTTSEVVDQLYRAYLAGNPEGMLALFSEDVSVRFLGQSDIRGIDEARRFFSFCEGLLSDVRFNIKEVVVDGEWAGVVWDEEATTRSGDPWSNHGVDVIRVQAGRITTLHENNDTRLVARFFPPYS